MICQNTKQWFAWSSVLGTELKSDYKNVQAYIHITYLYLKHVLYVNSISWKGGSTFKKNQKINYSSFRQFVEKNLKTSCKDQILGFPYQIRNEGGALCRINRNYIYVPHSSISSYFSAQCLHYCSNNLGIINVRLFRSLQKSSVLLSSKQFFKQIDFIIQKSDFVDRSFERY